MEEGARIENCQCSIGYDGGAMYIDDNMTLYMKGGVIDGCEAIGTPVTPCGTHYSDGGAIMLREGFVND